MISGLQHFAFCRRQWALIHIEQAWKENVHTTEGRFMHEKTHTTGSEKRGDTITTRNMPVFSSTLGINGFCDVVEFTRDEAGIPIHGYAGKYSVLPVEYKKGHPKSHNADALQVCAQAMCLEEMLVCDIPVAYLYYGETRRREDIELAPQLRQTVCDMLAEMHAYYKKAYTPKVKPSKSCKACSLADFCMPELYKTPSVLEYINKNLGAE